MTAGAFLDACGFNPVSSGTGDFVVSAAITGYQTPASAGAVNGTVYSYRAQSSDKSQWEEGYGAYASSTTTLARTTVTASSTGSKISFSSAPSVFITALSADLANALRAPRGTIWGLILSNDGTSPNTVIDIAAGEAASDNSTLPRLMPAAAYTKNCNAAWAVGSGNGALDSGSALAVSTWYHVFEIMRSDTGVVDYLLSTSATAPTMPTSYDHKRRIGSIKTDASAHILAFKQSEDFFYWAAPVSDSSTSPGSDTAITMSVPTGIRVEPFFHVNTETSSDGECSWRARSPDLQANDGTPNVSGNAAASFGLVTNVARITGSYERLLTNTSGQLTFIVSSAAPSFLLRTYGWCDTRGRLS
jgi:hypothetical protein